MIAVPYHLGSRGIGVGQGPLRILETLDRGGLHPTPITLDTAPDVSAGILPSLGILNRHLAEAVSQTAHPLILAGSCNSALGALAGLRRRGIQNPGIVWFDAHGDFNTPQTSLSGSPDGMVLAAAVGDCLPDLCAECGLTHAIAPENVVLAASRDLDPEEAVRLNSSRVSRAGIDDLAAAVESLAARVDAVYVHVDIDVLDPEHSPGVNCTTPGGLTPSQLLEAIHRVSARLPIAAATLANYNPDRDVNNRTLDIACELVDTLNGIMFR